MTAEPSRRRSRSAIERDEQLLDALGSGQPTTDGEPVTDLLAAWHEDVARAAERASARRRPPAGTTGGRAPRISGRRAALAAAAALTMAGTVGLTTFNATPQSPLWSLAEAVFPERARLVLAEQAIRDARSAAAEGRHRDAQRRLDEATRLLSGLPDEPRLQQLRGEIDTIRNTMPAEPPTVAPPTASTPSTGSTPPARPRPVASTNRSESPALDHPRPDHPPSARAPDPPHHPDTGSSSVTHRPRGNDSRAPRTTG